VKVLGGDSGDRLGNAGDEGREKRERRRKKKREGWKRKKEEDRPCVTCGSEETRMSLIFKIYQWQHR